jgi:mono/diheme cytochrome c family protein
MGRWIFGGLLALVFAFATHLALKRSEVPGASARRGAHLATIYGCTGCHGADLAGHEWETDPKFAIQFSSNLTRALPHYSDAQIDRALRAGYRPDGSALWQMPSFLFARMTQPEMRDLIAYLRTVPPTGIAHPRIVMGPQALAEIKAGAFFDSAVAAARYSRDLPIDAGSATARGRYIASITCAECHGRALDGGKGTGTTPDLRIIAAYDDAQFDRLMKTGKAANGREMELMSMVARGRFAHFTQAELVAVRDYLRARAALLH